MNPDRFAFDRASVRTVDVDGRMHVEISNISKATVNPYLGREIPGCTALGLDPMRTYMLLRDPDELQRAAPTFNNIPLLSRHVPVTADRPQKELVVGSTGTDAVFDSPYLKNSLVVWDSVAIAGIESKQQTELSSAYRYDADMTPGTFEGVAYDGVMRNIRGNHVALVEVGRAGPDVVVGDSQITQAKGTDMPMSKEELAIAKGKVIALAMDSKLTPSGQTKVKAALDLATDAESDPAKLEAALKMALALDEDDKVKPEVKPDPAEDEDDDDKQREGESDEDFKARIEAKKAKAEEDGKAAMDAAIKKAVDATEKATIQRMNAIRVAEKEVAPLIGEVVAQDSAEAVYKIALDSAKVSTDGVHPSAYRAMVGLLVKQADASNKPRVAMDSASTVSDFSKRFPEAVFPNRS